jgi:hypothetical protein
MAENTTDETVNFNSEDNSQGPTNPKDQRSGYSTSSEILKSMYYNTKYPWLNKKNTAEVSSFFKKVMDDSSKKSPQAKQTEGKSKTQTVDNFLKESVEYAKRPTSEVQKANLVDFYQPSNIKENRPVVMSPVKQGPKLEKAKANINTYENALIAVDNQAKLYDDAFPADMPMRDVLISQKKQEFLSRFKNGDLTIAKDDKGFPILKRVIDGTIANFIDGVQGTLSANAQVADFDAMDKDEQIAFMKGYRRTQIPTISESGRPSKTRYIDKPLDKDLGTVGMERRGAFAETAAMMGGVIPDIGTGLVVNALPGLGQVLSPLVVGSVQAKRQQFDSKNQAFQTAIKNGLSDDEAYEVANNFWNSKVSLMTGAAEGIVSQYLGSKTLQKFSEIAPARELKSFGQAAKAFIKDAASNAKELAMAGTLDGAVAYSMEKIRGGSDDSAEEQFKAEFLTQLGFAAIGGAVSVPKYVKSYAYNAISNLDNQTIYNNMVSMEQTGLVPEGTAKKTIEDINKFRDTKGKVTTSNQDAMPTVAGLTMRAESLQEQINNTPETDSVTLSKLNIELQQVNERISRAKVSNDPLAEEVDDITGLNIKTKQYATTISEQQQQESATEGNISEYQGTQGIQNQAPNETDNRYSAFGSQTKQQKIIIDINNADTVNIENPITPADNSINQASKMVSALRSVKPGIKIAAIPSIQEYGDTLIQAELDNGEAVSKQREKALRGSNGAYDPINDIIYLNLENINKRGKTSTLFHEGAHPIINMIAQQNSEAVGTLYNQLRDLSETIDGVNGVLAFGDGYSIYGDDTVKSEAIVEFIARVADGQIELPVEQPTVMQNILDVIRGFLDIIGLGTDINSLDDIKSIAAKIKEAFQTGREIVVVSETTGSATEAGITSDAIVINSGNITGNGRFVDKTALELELTDRNFDTNTVKYIKMSDLDGATGFVFAADKAVSGIIKSPSGYVHEFNGGVFYSYQDGTGVWAFTNREAAQKFLNKAKATDGVGLIMSQAPDGIKGSFDFLQYVKGELNNAIQNGVPEADIITYLNSKLNNKAGSKSGRTIKESIIKAGGNPIISSINDLDKALPISGPNLISYEVRGKYMQDVLSVFAEKNFGIPQFKSVLEYVNEPAIKNAEYGDIVAAIQIDKNSPIIDTRTDNRFKNHPSYPFVVTGTPIGIFEEFYDVRKIAPNFIPVSKEANQTPLGQREKPQAARSAMGGQPIVSISKQLALQQEETGRKSFKQTQKEANRTAEDVTASFQYDSKRKERAQTVITEKTKGSNLDWVNREFIDNQALTRKKLREAGERGVIVEALLTTSRGYGAEASLIAEDINAIVYDGLSEKKNIEIAGVKFSEVELLDEIMNQKRMISIQGMLKDNFDRLLSLQEKLNKTKSEKKKAVIQGEIEFIEDYLNQREVLGKKYNPQTKKSEYYLRNYQVGSTVDAKGNKIPNNAEMAKKKLAVIGQTYGKYNDLEKRASYMFDAYRGMLKDKYENGLVDKETYDILSKYDYVPISYIEHILNDEVPGYSKVTPKNPNQMTKSVLSGGADGDILTDFRAVLDLYANNHFKSIFNNRAAIGLVDLATENPNNGLVQMVESVKDSEGNELLNPDGNPRYPSPPEGKGYIYYYENGKRRAVVTDLVIANEWYETGKKDPDIFNAIGKATLAPFTQALLTGKNAGFGIFQMALLDPLTVTVATDVFSPSIPIAYAQIASGWKNAIVQVAKSGKDYRRAAAAGAFTQLYAGKELDSSLKYEGTIGKIGTAASKLADKLVIGKITDATEKATRLIVYLRAEKVFNERFVKENGRSPKGREISDIMAKAAHEARRSSDFARGGNTIKPLSKAFLYLNSTVQTGTAVLSQIKKNPARFIYQTSEFLTIAGGIQAMSAGFIRMPWEDDDEEFKKKQEMYNALSDYTKLNYLNIYRGGDNPEEAFIKIPLPPVIKNIWATGMMSVLNVKNNANYGPIDFVRNGLAVFPLGDVEGLLTKAPPLVSAAYVLLFNFDPFKKDLIVDNEKGMVDYLEGYKDKEVPGFVVSTAKNLKEYNINMSPKRWVEASKKITGDIERNPVSGILKTMIETGVELYSGAPVKVVTDFQKDWKKPILDAAGLSKRIYSGSYRYYESRVINEIAELKNMEENLLIEKLAKGEGSKDYKKIKEDISKANQRIVNFVKDAAVLDKDAYNKIVDLDKKGREVVSPSIMRKSQLQYIKNVFGPKYFELANIPTTQAKAKRIYDMASNMNEKESYEFFTNVVKLKIMTPSVAKAYNDISQEEE